MVFDKLFLMNGLILLLESAYVNVLAWSTGGIQEKFQIPVLPFLPIHGCIVLIKNI